MSYDISFMVKEKETDEWVSVDCSCLNITWNVRDIICESSGLEWKNCEDNGYVKDIIPYIQAGRDELCKNYTDYKKYEPDNGWGSVDSVIRFFDDIIDAWETLKRDKGERLANATHFWII